MHATRADLDHDPRYQRIVREPADLPEGSVSNLGYDEVWETASLNIDCNALCSALRARLHGAGPAPQLIGKRWLKVRGNASLSWKRQRKCFA